MEEIYVEFPANLKYLHLATSLCRILCEVLQQSRIRPGLQEDMELCVSEACTNAILHGSRTVPESKVFLRFLVDREQVIVHVGDQGRGFDLNQVPSPDLESYPEQGLGLFIIRSKMDRVRYVRGESENYLEMIKYYGEE